MKKRENQLLRVSEVGLWLKSYREQRNESLSSVAEQVKKLRLTSRRELEWLLPIKARAAVIQQRLRWLETTSLKQEKELRRRLASGDLAPYTGPRPIKDHFGGPRAVKGLRALLRAYAMPEMMLGPLFANYSERPFTGGSLANFKRHALQHVGKSAKYFYPRSRLPGATAFFVRLLLAPGGHSDIHVHPGKECIVVRGEAGAVAEFRLLHNGLRTPLTPNSFVLFSSEQPHCVYNHSKVPVELFIIRFVDLEAGGPHRKLVNDFDDFNKWFLDGERPKRRKDIPDNIKEFYSDFVLPSLDQGMEMPPEKCAAGDRITDQVGFGRLLQKLCPRHEIGKVYKVLPKKRAWQLRNGQIIGTVKDVKAHARALRLPMMLFAHVFFPRVPNFIVVQDTKDDLHPYPKALGRPRRGGRYQFPCRNLCDADDVVIGILNLKPSQSSLRNRHFGFELALPWKGSISVLFPQRPQWPDQPSAAADKGEYLHYRSDWDHQLVAGPKGARVFVLRFLGSENFA